MNESSLEASFANRNTFNRLKSSNTQNSNLGKQLTEKWSMLRGAR